MVLLSSRPGKGTVSAKGWTIRPVSGSAHSPAATGSESAVWPARYLPLGSGVKRDFACTFTRHLPVLVALRLQSRLRLEGRTRTLSGLSRIGALPASSTPHNRQRCRLQVAGVAPE